MSFQIQHVSRALVALLDAPQSAASLAAGAFQRYDRGTGSRLAQEILAALHQDGAVTGPDADGRYTLDRSRFTPAQLATLQRFRKPAT
jgi:hypothetical protein